MGAGAAAELAVAGPPHQQLAVAVQRRHEARRGVCSHRVDGRRRRQRRRRADGGREAQRREIGLRERELQHLEGRREHALRRAGFAVRELRGIAQNCGGIARMARGTLPSSGMKPTTESALARHGSDANIVPVNTGFGTGRLVLLLPSARGEERLALLCR